jgi:uncharacterized membrane protein YhaH (DUF805 family)
MDHSAAATAGLLAGFALIYAIVILAIVLFVIWVFWRIFEKAGFSGALSLLNLIPGIGHAICLLILAFSRWPVEDEIAAMSHPGSPQMPPPTPGASVIPT